MDLNRLKTMTKEQLIDIAKQVNAPVHHMNKSETIIENIINTVMQTTLSKPTEAAKEPEINEPVFLTESELEAALAPIKEKYKAFSTLYNHDEKCVTMRYNDGRYKHAETMSLSCPLTKFTRKAMEIAKGPLILRGQPGDWGKLGGVNPNNAYSESVLAG